LARINRQIVGVLRMKSCSGSKINNECAKTGDVANLEWRKSYWQNGFGKTTSSPKAAATSINKNVKTHVSLAAFKRECLNIGRFLSFLSADNSVVKNRKDAFFR
jgi:hypothetical protein